MVSLMGEHICLLFFRFLNERKSGSRPSPELRAVEWGYHL